MRKVLTVSILFLFILCLFGCDDMKENEEKKPTGNVFSTVYIISNAVQYEKLEMALFENELRYNVSSNPCSLQARTTISFPS